VQTADVIAGIHPKVMRNMPRSKDFSGKVTQAMSDLNNRHNFR